MGYLRGWEIILIFDTIATTFLLVALIIVTHKVNKAFSHRLKYYLLTKKRNRR